MLTHLSLFSGIGGLDLAAEWAGFETVGQCEWADYPTKVLEKHWPDVPRWRDVRELSADDFRRKTGRQTVTVISGGFPCQPHSLAGKRKASSDERDLWPEYRRIISEIKPRWVVAENVYGLLSSEDGRFFRGILRDFAQMGFNVGWATYPAAWVGAIHRRERMAIVAYAKSANVSRISKRKIQPERKGQMQFGRGFEELRDRPNSCTSRLCRSYDGIPGAIHRLKCLGNAVVPQQFYPIFKAIYELETEGK
jgi:DNA (cytosine-5)-methyltransferase 1